MTEQDERAGRCPVCNEALALPVKAHPRCWDAYAEMRAEGGALYAARLWPEDSGTWGEGGRR